MQYELKPCCNIMREMMENKLFIIGNDCEDSSKKALIMNDLEVDYEKFPHRLSWDYQVDFCPNCGKKVELICSEN